LAACVFKKSLGEFDSIGHRQRRAAPFRLPVFNKSYDCLNTLGTVEQMKPPHPAATGKRAKIRFTSPGRSSGIPVALLDRVSTDRQNTSRQITELEALATPKGWDVVEGCEEAGISGRAADDKRRGLIRAEELAASGIVKQV
jgi:hypothetical protein